MKQARRQALKALLEDSDNVQTLMADLQQVATEEAEKVDESGYTIPTLTNQEWESLSEWLLKPSKNSDWVPLYGKALKALKDDDRETFLLRYFMMFKRLRASLRLQFEGDTPSISQM